MHESLPAIFTLILLAGTARGDGTVPGHEAARREAERTGRPLLVLAASPGSDAASRRLLDEVLVDPAVVAWCDRHVIPVTLDPLLDAPEGDRVPAPPALVESLRIDALPLVLLVEPDGTTISRLRYEDQDPAQVVEILERHRSTRRSWKARLARLDAPDDATRLAEATHLLRHCLPVLGESAARAAEVLLALDPQDRSELLLEAATVLALRDHPRRADALLLLERAAPRDPAKRHAYVLFQRTTRTLEALIAANGGLEPPPVPTPGMQRLAAELVEAVRVARPHAPSAAVEAQLVGRAALAFHLTGDAGRARALMQKARALAGEEVAR